MPICRSRKGTIPSLALLAAASILLMFSVAATADRPARAPTTLPTTSPAAPTRGVHPAGADAGPYERIGRVEGAWLSWRPQFNRYGTAFATQTRDAVRVWDAGTLKPLTEPLRHDGLVSYRLSADGKTVLTAGGQEVRLWDVATSRLRSSTTVAAKKVDFAELSPDGAQFVTVVREDMGTAAVWHAGEARASALLRHRGAAISAEFDPTGRWVVTHEFGTAFRVWAADTGREACPPIASDDDCHTPYRAQFDPSGKRLVVPLAQGYQVIDVKTGRVLSKAQLQRRRPVAAHGGRLVHRRRPQGRGDDAGGRWRERHAGL